jgi:hypothetical protein
MKLNLASVLVPAVVLMSAGCATNAGRNAGMGPIRYWGDEISPDLVEEFKRKLAYMPRMAEVAAGKRQAYCQLAGYFERW